MEKPKKPELIVIANDDCNFGNKDLSLQGGFKNFRSFINSKERKILQDKKKKEKTQKICKNCVKNF